MMRAACLLLVAALAAATTGSISQAQQPTETPDTSEARPGPWTPQVAPARPAVGRENVEADVSTRSVAVTSSFTGTEIVIFGAIDNASHSSLDGEQYEIVITLEGTRQRLVTRRKSRVAGIWINTEAVEFSDVPSYYAIASTRPLDEIAEPTLLRQRGIGFEQVRMQPASETTAKLSATEVDRFKRAVIRVKQKEGLYVDKEFGVRFVGRNLFRATIDLPANVPIGPIVATVYLFKKGQLLSTFESRVQLSRQGIERVLYDFAFGYPMIYGIFAVILAAAAGLAASSIFQRRRS